MKKCKSIIVLLVLVITGFPAISQVKQIATAQSPDKETRFELNLTSEGNLQYRTVYAGKEVLAWSKLGLDLNDAGAGDKTIIRSQSQKSHSENISWSIGENDVIKNSYNELNINCSAGTLKYKILIRAYNGSIAFRYILPEQNGIKKLIVKKEVTQFNFTDSFKIYQYHHESVFTPIEIDSMKTTSDLPSTLTSGKLFLSIGEASNDNYTKAELARGASSNSLEVSFARDVLVNAVLPFQTPWRTVSFSESAIGLHRYSELPLKLSEQPYKKIPAWIKPGKLIRSELNTQSGMDCIDLAEKLNFQYIMFDAGWYGPERALSSDPAVAIPQLDLQKVIQYGKENGIGVILYVNYIGLRNHLDTILPLYKQWGISGLKFGFVDGFTQKGITWLAGAIKKVNDAGLLLNIHDNYKPTGLNRTRPALLSQEGIRGDENSPDAFHTTVLPYTRFLAGAADFTFCFPNPKNSFSKNLKVSKAQQLALTVVYFSPLQSIFWYGRPKDYTNWDEIEFFKYVPTTWNESRYLMGEIGENISVARRKNDTWFVGSAAGLKDWKGNIVLDFLQSGKKYTATIYEDSAKGNISKRVINVKKGDYFPFEIKASGGLAMMIQP
ncbi:MAG TPA: glycoside hydrolase family 97 catalytic domain-containing protein [Pedobacter sp.]|uniref:glycoside hydrolase family 97 protein n=1 Tax=Pedobacter sp. TaxID=1411316 RepID=UPI002BA65F21|nr:glycoside hydrolase family 97 catalytic domain-containing protein [Pedobacter sp.]HMI02815.1 glycoside hydrolase family 97 catalytic domain-containing protein [Pedobacter sp.]